MSLYVDIERERHAQVVKWGGPTVAGNVESHGTDNGFRLGVLMEEVGEVATALIEKESPDRVRAELVQVAAVAVAWIEGIDREMACPKS